MKNKKLILGGIVGVTIIGLVIVLIPLQVQRNEYRQEVSTEDPTDITLDFYEQWVAAVRSTSTSPQDSGLANTPLLSKTLSEKLSKALQEQDTDPVFCQNILPEKISSKTIIEEEDTVQILVLSKEPKQASQTVFVLKRLNEGWFIDDILCLQEEPDMNREFTFEHEGGIYRGGLYKKVQTEDNKDYWSLLYTQDSKVYTAQLIFTADSMCTDIAGNESVCDPSQFTEMKVMIQGQMTENGVTVTQVKSLPKE